MTLGIRFQHVNLRRGGTHKYSIYSTDGSQNVTSIADKSRYLWATGLPHTDPRMKWIFQFQHRSREQLPLHKEIGSRGQLDSFPVYLPDKSLLLSWRGVGEGQGEARSCRSKGRSTLSQLPDWAPGGLGKVHRGVDPRLIPICSAAVFIFFVAIYQLCFHSCDRKYFHHSGHDTKTPGFEMWKILSKDCESSLKIETLKAPERKV